MVTVLIGICAVICVILTAGLGLVFWRLTQILFILRWWKVEFSDARKNAAAQLMPRPPDGRTKPQTSAEEYAAPMIRRARMRMERVRSEAGYETD